MAKAVHIERSIRAALPPAAYAQLVKDLRAAQRAFDRLEQVAPELLRSLVRTVNKRRGTLVSAHEAIDDLIEELRQQRAETTPETDRPIELVKR